MTFKKTFLFLVTLHFSLIACAVDVPVGNFGAANEDCVSEILKTPNSSEFTTKSGKKIAYIYDDLDKLMKLRINDQTFSVVYVSESSTEVLGLQSDVSGKMVQVPENSSNLEDLYGDNKFKSMRRMKKARLKCEDFVEKRTSDAALSIFSDSRRVETTQAEDDGGYFPVWPEDIPIEYASKSYWRSELDTEYFFDPNFYISLAQQKQCIQRIDVCTGKCDDSGDKSELACAAFGVAFIEIPVISGVIALACTAASKGIRKQCKETCGSFTECF